MKFLKRIYKSANFWPLLIVIFFGLLAGRTLLAPGYFNMHDDLQMMRQLEMEKCFLDLQIPCRWIPDMGYGFGFPLFNFYPPLPYLFGMLFRIVGISFVLTVKLTFVFSFIASGVTMYFLAREFFGKRGGILAAIFYIWAPYHSVDVFVRGAMNEAWALIWFPAILYFSYKIISRPAKLNAKWGIVGLALSYFALFTSHNLMVLIFTPIFAIWCGIWLVRARNFSRIPQLLFSGILAFGLTAFFTIPVILESKFVQTNTLVAGYYEYNAHFASLSQLFFSRFWGYGPSVWLEEDRMPFQIGHLHWILALAVGLLIITKFFKDKKISNLLLASSFMLSVGWLSAFMAHSRSTPIWQLIPAFKFVQFPWRFLTLVILGFSFAIGALENFIPKKSKLGNILLVVLVGGVLFLNWDYFYPEYKRLGPITDKEKFSGAAWELQQTAGIYDYLPNTAKTAPKAPRQNLTEVLVGQARIGNEKEGTNWAKFEIDVTKDAQVRLGIFKFPGWKTFVDGKEVKNYVPESEEWGRMYIDIPTGKHFVDIKLHNTWPRTLGNIISLISWTGLFVFIITNRKIFIRLGKSS